MGVWLLGALAAVAHALLHLAPYPPRGTAGAIVLEAGASQRPHARAAGQHAWKVRNTHLYLVLNSPKQLASVAPVWPTSSG